MCLCTYINHDAACICAISVWVKVDGWVDGWVMARLHEPKKDGRLARNTRHDADIETDTMGYTLRPECM